MGLKSLLLLLSGCGGSMDKFDWKASDSAPENLPMKIVQGDFYYPEGGSLYVPTKASLYKGWGQPESSHLVGPELKPLPNRLEILYFSYLENEFYRGDFKLPYDRILKLFQTKYYSLRAKEMVRLDEITVGVAPGGSVAVWLRGIDNMTEVFYGKAEQVEGNWQKVTKSTALSRNEYVQFSLNEDIGSEAIENFRKNGIDFTQWDKFRKRYHWTPLLNIPPPLNYIRQIDSFNGEVGYMKYPLDDTEKNKTRVVPEALDIVWKSPQGLILYLEYRFDEDEIFNAFEKLAPTVNGESKTPVQLEISIVQNDAGKNVYSVNLRNDMEVIPLNKTDLKISRTNLTEDEL